MLVDSNGQPINPQKTMIEEQSRFLKNNWEQHKESVPEQATLQQIHETAAEAIAKLENQPEMKYMILASRASSYEDAFIENDIQEMNKMMNVPCPGGSPTLERLEQFHKILQDEVNEIDEILKLAHERQELYLQHDEPVESKTEYFTNKTDTRAVYAKEDEAKIKELDKKILVAYLDLLADICVFCYSEAQRLEIKLSSILHVVMSSNFTKLPADGKPIWKDGKFLKGELYMKPEKAIEELLNE